MPIHATHPHTTETITANIHGTALVISPRYGVSYSFDEAGRLLSLFERERSYQRTLDHRLLERQRGRGLAPRRRALDPAESDAVLARVFADLRNLAHTVNQLDLTTAEQADLARALDTIVAFGPDRLQTDGANFRLLYKPVSILPPDQYLALVLQATEGCSWNRCTFCGLYRDRGFRIHSPASFRVHCERVRDYFGAGLSLRRGIFLADANALITAQTRLREFFEIAQDVFALPDGPRPVYSFVSAFDVERKSAAEWCELHEIGLQRAYIGLETGDDDLLQFLNKPGTAQDAIDAVQALRAGGIAVGVIVMAGIGGDRYAHNHIEHTVATVEAMNLGRNDQVYISNYVSAPGTEYDALAAQADIEPLSPDQIHTQRRILQVRLRAVAPDAKIAPYHVDGFAL